jgi:hypothetical protein
MPAALTCVREVIGKLRLPGKKVALSVSGNLSIDTLGTALFTRQDPLRMSSHVSQLSVLPWVKESGEVSTCRQKILPKVPTVPHRTIVVCNKVSTFFRFSTGAWMGKFCCEFVGGREEMNGTYIWQPAYLAAVYETNDEVMIGRILEARAAIEQRLLVPIEEDSLEYRELLAAQKALEVLKFERVDQIDLHPTASSGAMRPVCDSDARLSYGS